MEYGNGAMDDERKKRGSFYFLSLFFALFPYYGRLSPLSERLNRPKETRNERFQILLWNKWSKLENYFLASKELWKLVRWWIRWRHLVPRAFASTAQRRNKNEPQQERGRSGNEFTLVYWAGNSFACKLAQFDWLRCNYLKHFVCLFLG